MKIKLKFVTTTATPRILGARGRISELALTTSRLPTGNTEPIPTMSGAPDKRPREPEVPEGLQSKATAVYQELQTLQWTKIVSLTKLAARKGGIQRIFPALATLLKFRTSAGLSTPMTAVEALVVALNCLYLQRVDKGGRKYRWQEDPTSVYFCKLSPTDGKPGFDWKEKLCTFLATHIKFYALYIGKATEKDPSASISKEKNDQLRVIIGMLIGEKLNEPTDAEVQELALVVFKLTTEFPGRRLIPLPAPNYVGVSGVTYVSGGSN